MPAPVVINTAAIKKHLKDALPPPSHPDYDRQLLLSSVISSFAERLDAIEEVTALMYKKVKGLGDIIKAAMEEPAPAANGATVSATAAPAAAATESADDGPEDLRPSTPGATVITSVKPNGAVPVPPAAMNPPSAPAVSLPTPNAK